MLVLLIILYNGNSPPVFDLDTPPYWPTLSYQVMHTTRSISNNNSLHTKIITATSKVQSCVGIDFLIFCHKFPMFSPADRATARTITLGSTLTLTTTVRPYGKKHIFTNNMRIVITVVASWAIQASILVAAKDVVTGFLLNV